MKKLIETMAALVVAIVLVGALIGWGNAAPEQGKVDTTPPDPKNMEKDMEAMTGKSKDGQKEGKGGKKSGGPSGGSGELINPSGGKGGGTKNPGGGTTTPPDPSGGTTSP